jgi:hypothetical protein
MMMVDRIKKVIRELILKEEIADERVEIVAFPISPREAMGVPPRPDFAIVTGSVVMIEAEFLGSLAQAFASEPQKFSGTVSELFSLSFTTEKERALLLAASSAILAHFGLISGVRHCRDDAPERCASSFSEKLAADFPQGKFLFVDFQPSMVDHMVDRVGEKRVIVLDYNPTEIKKKRSGITAVHYDLMGKVAREAGVILASGSGVVKGVFDDIFDIAKKTGIPLFFFGVSSAVPAYILSLPRFCPYASDS